MTRAKVSLCGLASALQKKITHFVTGKKLYSYQTPAHSMAIQQEIQNFHRAPLISVVISVYNASPKWIKLAISSVQKQWYTNWQICIVSDSSSTPATKDYLNTLQQEITKDRIKIHFSETNESISTNINKALAMADGKYIAQLGHDDMLAVDALYEVVKVLNHSNTDFIYSDEDRVDIRGYFSEPHFKPDYSYFRLCSQNYIQHLSVIKKLLIDEVGGFKENIDKTYNHDLYLRIAEKKDNFYHIPKVLYHFRKKTNSNPARYQIVYDIIGNPLVSIIIPFKDKPELLNACISSILMKTNYQNFEIIAINNRSCHPETFELIKLLQVKDSRIRIHNYDGPFNYSRINNYGVSELSSGEYIVLLNNDIEIISPNWIETMLGFAQQPAIGCVGAKLYYPNDTVQHGGVLVGVGHVAAHAHRFFPKESTGYHGRLAVDQELSAVTGAMLMVKTEKYRLLKGLNEKDLAIAYNDVDFCLRLIEHGFTNIFTPHAEAYHHESLSREADESPSQKKRYDKEVKYMWQRHSDILHNGDPFYNPNLTITREDFSLKA